MAYLWFRFEWQFGLAGLLSLIHDVIVVIGIFALLGMEFNLTIVAAVLTVAGYSINDSVVVFDRVRENMRKYKTMPLFDLIDLSINQTLSRTFLTGITTIMVLLSLYFLGGEVLRGFSFALLFGIIIGTYSSIFVAVPLLLYLNVRRITGQTEPAVAGAP
jgi:preprotein translocase SecF subunit